MRNSQSSPDGFGSVSENAVVATDFGQTPLHTSRLVVNYRSQQLLRRHALCEFFEQHRQIGQGESFEASIRAELPRGWVGADTVRGTPRQRPPGPARNKDRPNFFASFLAFRVDQLRRGTPERSLAGIALTRRGKTAAV